jgi:hypothetical protein
MAIKMRQAPASGFEVLSKGLGDLSSLDSAGVEESLGGGPTEAAHPIPLYSIGLTDLVEGVGLTGARQTGWRYLVFGPSGVGIADLDEAAGGGRPQFGGLQVGQRAKCLELALKYAGDTHQAGEDVYEIRILEIPALYTSTVWLSDHVNIFIPFMEDGKLCDVRAVEEKQFLTKIKKKASMQLDHLRDDRQIPEPG